MDASPGGQDGGASCTDASPVGQPEGEAPARLSRTGEVALLFLRLGATAFGGPAAHIAMMRDELVRRRRWLTDGQFLDLLSLTYLIPGPNSTEMAIHLGYLRAGWAGLVAGGLGFIVPAFCIVLALAWSYVRFGTLPQAGALLYGIKPVMLAVVAQAVWELGRLAIRTPAAAAFGAGSLALYMAGIHELAVLFGAGVLFAAARLARAGRTGGRQEMAGMAASPELAGGPDALSTPAGAAAGVAAGPAGSVAAGAAGSVATGAAAGATATATAGAAAVPFSPATLFAVFLKVGALLYGSGYVLLAFLRRDLVERLGWLSDAGLMDAIAVGQVTPGPVFTTATFVGYVLGGGWGAVLATVAIFLPSFIFVAAIRPLGPALRRGRWTSAFLDGLNVASLGLMAGVTFDLARATLVDPFTWGLAALALAALVRWRVNSAGLILFGGLAGLLLRALGARPWWA